MKEEIWCVFEAFNDGDGYPAQSLKAVADSKEKAIPFADTIRKGRAVHEQKIENWMMAGYGVADAEEKLTVLLEGETVSSHLIISPVPYVNGFWVVES